MQILLYKLRKEKGLSQKEMAKLINKSETSYRNKELGKTDFTQSEMFIIARHFNRELGDIFTP
ncbi:helix-turn-helix transcriptional regulator [Streptococcus koreensis]|jgi:putative transcriptional regulator|uniref:helix-turn-helix transcriptional regulator n=1 Tax=Streptococcus TaxID=1301 RepID=UPI00204EBF24|nr:helix-turn-helix transcriptional regulator [Salmonella enterica]DAX43656.1 MAG TPA: Helix-turn-helix XRE-family like protein [Caudoviricetes sp.]